MIGAQVDEVDEPQPWFNQPVVSFEFEAYPEAKALLPSAIRALYAQYQSFQKVAVVTGASEAFVRQNSKKK